MSQTNYLANIYNEPRLILKKGAGSWVWDQDDQKYLDFTAGLGVLALGHSFPGLVEVLSSQFATLDHCSNLFNHESGLRLAEKLVKASFAHQVCFASSGTEACEAALKFARLHGLEAGGSKKNVFLAFRGGFHGRTMGSLSVTFNPSYREPFIPLLPNVRFVDFNDLASLREAFDQDVCGAIIEPVQGEGGVIPVDQNFLYELRTLCNAHQAILIFDEVQCGLGRTGKLFAYQNYEVTPDILCLAKPLGGGLPLGAVLLNKAVSLLLKPGLHGSTFAGGPVTTALGLKIFEEINRPAFLERVNLASMRLHAGLSQIVNAASPIFSGVRGLGLMQALVIADPQTNVILDLVKRARSMGLLLTRAGKDALRLLPPLNVTDAEIDHSLEILTRLGRLAS